MAIYHFTAKIIKRSHGRSAVAAAAYRSASAFTDQRQGQSFDYSDKARCDPFGDSVARRCAGVDEAIARRCGTGSRRRRNCATPRSRAKSSSPCPRS